MTSNNASFKQEAIFEASGTGLRRDSLAEKDLSRDGLWGDEFRFDEKICFDYAKNSP